MKTRGEGLPARDLGGKFSDHWVARSIQIVKRDNATYSYKVLSAAGIKLTDLGWWIPLVLELWGESASDA